MSVLIGYESLSKSYGSQNLFSGISISFKGNEKIGLIGINGSGKSTLLKIFKGLEQCDSGDVIRKKHLNLVYIPQSEDFDPDKRIPEILYDVIQNLAIEEHEKYARINRFSGLGKFPDPEMKSGLLSGGWKKRLSIICALIQEPELLLLDEPTNHLDIEGIFWLEGILKKAFFSFVVVSHDRYFLENTTDKTIELGRTFPGGYLKINHSYLKYSEKRALFLENQLKKERSLSTKMKRESEWLSRNPKARTTKAKFRIDAAEKLKTELKDVHIRNLENKNIGIDFNATNRRTKKLMEVFYVSKKNADQVLFKNISLRLSPGSRLGLVGNNGTGKSTFIKILAKLVKPDDGKINWVEGLKVVYFDQERFQPDLEVSLKKALSPDGDSVVYRGRSYHVASWARRFLFSSEQLDMPVKRLSGGERARILIANLMLQEADVLLLDEPANDLDIPSIEILEESIMDFPGAVVMVSHDRYMLDRMTNQVLGFDGFGNAEFFADYSQWYRDLSEKKKEKKVTDKIHSGIQKKKVQSRVKKAKTGKLSYKDQYELDHLEEKIQEAEKAVSELEKGLDDPSLSVNPDILKDHCDALKQAQDVVENLYDRWEFLEQLKDQ